MSKESKVVSDRDRARLQLKEYVIELAAARGQEDDVIDKLIIKVNEAFDMLLSSHVELVLSLGESLSDESHENFMYEASDERDEAVEEAEEEKVKAKKIIKEKTIKESIKDDNLGLMGEKDQEEFFDKKLEISHKVSQEVVESELFSMFSAWAYSQIARLDASPLSGDVPHKASRMLCRISSSKQKLPSIPGEIFDEELAESETEFWSGDRVQVLAASSTEVGNGDSHEELCEGPHDVTSEVTNQEPIFESERVGAATAHVERVLGHVVSDDTRQSYLSQLDSERASVETNLIQNKLKTQSAAFVPKSSYRNLYSPSATPQDNPSLQRPKKAYKRLRHRTRRKLRRCSASYGRTPAPPLGIMFDPSKLDMDNQIRIRALKEEDMAETAMRFGKAKARAWGADHVFVPVAEAERRESLVPLTGCKCEEGLGLRPGHIGQQHMGIHMARVVVDRLRHEEPGNDLGMGKAGEGAMHMTECQQMERWNELVTKRRAQQEADRRKAREEEAKKEMEERVQKILKIKVGIPKEEGRATLMRKGKRAALEIEEICGIVVAPQGETSCDRARRLIRSLQLLKKNKEEAGKLSKNVDESNDRGSNAVQSMIRWKQKENITMMQKKLARLVIKKEAKSTEDGKPHLM